MGKTASSLMAGALSAKADSDRFGPIVAFTLKKYMAQSTRSHPSTARPLAPCFARKVLSYAKGVRE